MMKPQRIGTEVLTASHDSALSAMAGRFVVRGTLRPLKPEAQSDLMARHPGLDEDGIDAAFLISALNKMGVKLDD